jgi:hypothetical protein
MKHLHGLHKTALALVLVAATGPAHAETAQGTVFNDANGNGQLDKGERGLKNVGVSNGREVVKTDRNGFYELPVGDDTMIFVIKPSVWRTPQNENGINHFYYNHKPAGSQNKDPKYEVVAPTGPLPKAINFPLYKQKESDTFKMICFGDTQPRNQEEVDYIAHDVVQELIGFDAAFGVTLGDVVFNSLDMLKPLEEVVGRIGVPWYPVHGNHDVNAKFDSEETSDETWETLYGPTYYSYNYGNVHFITLDDIAWNSQVVDGKVKNSYHGELGEKQLAFIKNDLALVDKDALVVMMMHIPLTTVDDNAALFALLQDRPNTFTVSAHWHRQAHFFMGEEYGWNRADKHHHLVHATVCGSWWTGAKDENGIPHTTMSDGAPNGYSIITFNDDDYTIRFKAARRPADHQMNIYAPEFIEGNKATEAQVVVNVFAGSERSTVDMRVDDSGEWLRMAQTIMKDPYFEEVKAYEAKLPPEAGRKLPDARETDHIWTANFPESLTPGLHMIHVRTTDMFGQTYTDQRSIRVE